MIVWTLLAHPDHCDWGDSGNILAEVQSGIGGQIMTAPSPLSHCVFKLILHGYFKPKQNATIQYGYIIEAAISYYPIRNGWKLWYGKYGLFYYKSIQDWWSYDLQNLGLKIHNFSLELKQSKTPPVLDYFNSREALCIFQSI